MLTAQFRQVHNSYADMYCDHLTCALMQVLLLLGWMLAWCITPSLRWVNDGSLTICWPSLPPSRTSLKTLRQYSSTTEFWYVIYFDQSSQNVNLDKTLCALTSSVQLQ